MHLCKGETVLTLVLLLLLGGDAVRQEFLDLRIPLVAERSKEMEGCALCVQRSHPSSSKIMAFHDLFALLPATRPLPSFSFAHWQGRWGAVGF